MFATLIVLSAVLLFGLLTFTPAVRRSQSWSATVTPLASIMGSGFLVSAPLLAGIVGNFSPLVMAGLLAVAWAIGGAIRFNIMNAEPIEDNASAAHSAAQRNSTHHTLHTSHRLIAALPVTRIEQLSHLVLAAAYFISVTYYIQLLCQFTLYSLGVESAIAARIMATVLLAVISAVGFLFGLKMIERVERYAINLNLSMIGALLVGLAGHNLQLWSAGDWKLPVISTGLDTWTTVRICMGLLVVVQGFETSRFLGAEHPASRRIKTMRWAQGLATVIYLVFLALMLVVITPEQAKVGADVTAIVALAGGVAIVLPAMLTIGAVGSQFSAAVADEAGCGGLLSHLAGKYLNDRTAYLCIGAITITLAWAVDVMQVIALASRAFALFYCLQCVVAATIASARGGRHILLGVWFAVLALTAFSITVLGISSE